MFRLSKGKKNDLRSGRGYFGVLQGHGACWKLTGPETTGPDTIGGGALNCCGGGTSGVSQRLSNPNIFLHVAVQPVCARTNPASAIRTKKRFMLSP